MFALSYPLIPSPLACHKSFLVESSIACITLWFYTQRINQVSKRERGKLNGCEREQNLQHFTVQSDEAAAYKLFELHNLASKSNSVQTEACIIIYFAEAVPFVMSKQN